MTPKRPIIAFTGLAGAGKSTAALHLVDRHGFERVRFAGPLKDMMRALGLTEREIDGDLKERPCALLTFENYDLLVSRIPAALIAIGVTQEQIDAKYEPIPLLCGHDALYATTAYDDVLYSVLGMGRGASGAPPRLLMQHTGTEWGRDLIGGDLWVKAWEAAVARLPAAVPVVVDDCRFPNEAAAIRAMGGFLVHVHRPGLTLQGHVSEGQDLGPVAGAVNNTAHMADFLAAIDREMRELSWVGNTH